MAPTNPGEPDMPETITAAAGALPPVAFVPPDPKLAAADMGGKLRKTMTALLAASPIRGVDLEHRFSSFEKAVSGCLDTIRARPIEAEAARSSLRAFLTSWRAEFEAWVAVLADARGDDQEALDEERARYALTAAEASALRAAGA